MKKSKLTYRNEITITIVEFPRMYFRMRRLLSDQDICNYCVRVFTDNVKCPIGTAFGGVITKDEERVFECSIHEQDKGYAGKVIFVYPIIS
jgi:hypothetical protein